jgi:uncharacterized membrane protein YtjA (UPF0391 family)
VNASRVQACGGFRFSIAGADAPDVVARHNHRAVSHRRRFDPISPDCKCARRLDGGWNFPQHRPFAAQDLRGHDMTILKWALIFLVISVIAGIFGFTGISAASADVARVLFYVFVVIFLVLLILGFTIFRA